MTDQTTTDPGKLRRIRIEPLTRVEGHGKVTLLLDEDNHVVQARLHIVEFRGFEKFIQGRPCEEVPILVQRLCGICPVSHLLAASKALDQMAGVDRLTPAAEKQRRLLHFGQVLQSHALHFFYLAAPDLLFGFDSEPQQRNILGVMESHRDVALKGIRMRKYGQEVIRTIVGKRIHGVGPLPGGMNKALTLQDRDYLLTDIDQTVHWCQDGLALIKAIYLENPEYHTRFAMFRSNFMSLAREDGALELYHGRLRARDTTGETIFDQVECCDYNQYLREEVKLWSYMKFPYIRSLGSETGWYRVGPLARINNCDFIDTPLAEQARQEFIRHTGGLPVHASLAYHWARMIEVVHCAEAIRELLHDPDLLSTDLLVEGTRRREGIGVIEAPRGTLFHHYRVDEEGVVEKANLIVSTTNNNQAMNEAVRRVAADYLDGHTLTGGLLNRIEVAIRAYDPCLSCATHAIGKMPLQVELHDAEGKLLDRLIKNSNSAS